MKARQVENLAFKLLLEECKFLVAELFDITHDYNDRPSPYTASVIQQGSELGILDTELELAK